MKINEHKGAVFKDLIEFYRSLDECLNILMLQELGQKEGLVLGDVQVCSHQLHQARMVDLAHDVNLLQQIPRGMQVAFSVFRIDLPGNIGPTGACQDMSRPESQWLMLRSFMVHVEEFQPVSSIFSSYMVFYIEQWVEINH